MKINEGKRFYLSVFIILAVMMIFVTVGQSLADSSSRVILYTYYWEIGEDDRIDIGTIDEKGVIRTFYGKYSDVEQKLDQTGWLELLSKSEMFTVEGQLSSDELFSIKSLLYSVEDQGSHPVYTNILDGGTEESYAVLYSSEDRPSIITLGISGIECFENTDPNAQALYLRLRQLFPRVASFAYKSDDLGPVGFVPVPLSEFIGLDADAVSNAEIEGYYVDSEEGNLPMELTDTDKKDLVDLIQKGTVTGKVDAIYSTGGYSVYIFYAQDGVQIGNLTLQDGLLVTEEGRYFVGG